MNSVLIRRVVTRSFAIAGLAFSLVGASFAQHYTRTDLTANSASVSSAPVLDPNLVNPWGLSRASSSPWWTSDEGTGLSTLYNATGAIQGLVVTIPRAAGGKGPSSPTGTVFNYTTNFWIGPKQPAVFLFSSLDGTISGWNPGANGTVAIQRISRPLQAVYTGLAIATASDGPRLYAANFLTGKVDVFDAQFKQITKGGFQDSTLPEHYVPFGIQTVGGNIVVTFAQHEPGSKFETHGAGLGYVRVFDTDGNLLLRVQHGDYLNAPWGVALAPGDFGPFSHRLLIGNFGDGTIHAFNALTGKFEGTLLNPDGTPTTIDGLWALSFAGDSANNGNATDLYFTAGPNFGGDGILGKLTATAAEQRGNSE